MSTTTKKELIDRVADETNQKRTVVQKTIQSFLNNVVHEISQGKRLEFRDFGVFETRIRAARIAQNPKTLERVFVPPRAIVKFKESRMMRDLLDQNYGVGSQRLGSSSGRNHDGRSKRGRSKSGSR